MLKWVSALVSTFPRVVATDLGSNQACVYSDDEKIRQELLALIATSGLVWEVEKSGTFYLFEPENFLVVQTYPRSKSLRIIGEHETLARAKRAADHENMANDYSCYSIGAVVPDRGGLCSLENNGKLEKLLESNNNELEKALEEVPPVLRQHLSALCREYSLFGTSRDFHIALEKLAVALEIV